MASNFLFTPTAQDKKISELISSVPLPVLQAYLGDLVRSPVESKDREEAILLFGMIVYKSDPPGKIWDGGALYEYIGLLKSHVRRCERDIREDLKTPRTRAAEMEDASTTDGAGKVEIWEVVEPMPLPRQPGSVPADNGKGFFESRNFRPRTTSQASTVPRDSGKWETIPLSTPKKSSTGVPTLSLLNRNNQLNRKEEEQKENQQKEESDKPQENLTVRAAAGEFLNSGITLFKSIVNAIPFNTPTPTPQSDQFEQLQEILNELNAVENLQTLLKDVIGGFRGPDKRKDAVLILGIISFLYGNTQSSSPSTKRKVPGLDDCVAVYGYIPMMRKYVVEDLHIGWKTIEKDGEKRNRKRLG